MAGLWGSTNRSAYRTISGRIGYTGKRRREAAEGMGYEVDRDGFIVGLERNPNAPRTASAPAAGSGGQAMMQPFAAMLPGLLQNQAAFARPEAAQALASMFGRAAPAWAGGAAPPPAGGSGGGAGPIMSILPYTPGGPTGAPPMQVPQASNPFAAVLAQLFNRRGTPGPAPSPFANLGRFAGTFGNGGAAMLPSFLQPGRIM